MGLFVAGFLGANLKHLFERNTTNNVHVPAERDFRKKKLKNVLIV